MQTFEACYLCIFNVAAIFWRGWGGGGGGESLHVVYYSVADSEI